MFGPTWRLILSQRDKLVAILIMNLHIPLSSVDHLGLSLPEIPFRELVLGDEPVGRINVDLREKLNQSSGDVEPLFVVEVILGVHVLVPFRLGLVAGGGGGIGGGFRVGVLEELALPLAVLAAALDAGDEGVECGGSVVAGGGGEVGAEAEAAVAVAERGGGFLRRTRD